MRDSIHDDLDSFESMPASSKSMTMLDELEEYTPRLPKKLMPVDEDFSFLMPGEPAPLSEVVTDSEGMLSIFDELTLEELAPDYVLPVRKSVDKSVPVRIKDSLSPEMLVFLKNFMSTGTLTGALRRSKMSVARYRKWLELSPKFTQAYLDSTEAVADRLETEALKQALSGNTKVLLKSLEALRPGKWGRSSTVNTFLDGKLKVEVTNWADLVQKADIVDISPTMIEGEVE